MSEDLQRVLIWGVASAILIFGGLDGLRNAERVDREIEEWFGKRGIAVKLDPDRTRFISKLNIIGGAALMVLEVILIAADVAGRSR